jgi:Secretion system C-terminal sorting domain
MKSLRYFALFYLVFVIVTNTSAQTIKYFEQRYKFGLLPQQVFVPGSNSDTLLTGMGPIGYKTKYTPNWNLALPVSVTLDSMFTGNGNDNSNSGNTSRLVFRRASVASPNTAYLSRTTDFSPVPTSLMTSFQIRINDEIVGEPNALQFVIGSNFTDDATLPNNADIYAKFGISTISHTLAEDKQFKIVGDADTSRKFTFGPNPLGQGYPRFYQITFVTNNGTVPITYNDEFGHVGTVAPDKFDVWVGPQIMWVDNLGTWVEQTSVGSIPTLVLDESPVSTPTQSITDFKVLFTGKEKTEILFDNFIIKGSSANLPVEYTYFNARLNEDNKVQLDWATASEHSSDHFVVQRSTDLETFTDIAYRKAAGESRDLIQYSAIDESPLSGTSYYRLKQVDSNGLTNYSRPKSINMEDAFVRVYPNPADGKQFFVKVIDSNIAEVSLHTSAGVLIPTKQQIRSEHLLEISPEQTLPKGLYLVQVRNETSTTTKKLVIE